MEGKRRRRRKKRKEEEDVKWNITKIQITRKKNGKKD